MSSHLILIDGDNLSHRNFHAMNGSLLIKNPIVYGILRDACTLRQTLMEKKMVFCFDGTETVDYRKEYFPDYKANRKNNEAKEKIKAGMAEAKALLTSLGFEAILRPGWEGDDLLAHIVKSATNKDDKYTIISTDMDMYQLLAPNVQVYDPLRKFTATSQWLYRTFDVHPGEWVEYKALVGDKADNINGVEGVGAATACKYIRDYAMSERLRKKIDCSPHLIERNMILMRLPFKLLPPFELAQPLTGKGPDGEHWDKLVSEAGCPTFVGKWE